MASVTAKTKLDAGQLQRMLRGRNGHVGRMMAAFAGLATQEVRSVARSRVRNRTGQYIGGISSTTEGASSGVKVVVRASAAHSMILELGSRPHVITPKAARVLRFEAGGGIVYARRVMHPGTRPYNILRDGVQQAGGRLGSIG